MSQPSKEQVRQWLLNEVKRHMPPPDPKQIKRDLGWYMVKSDKIQGRKH